MRALKCQTVPNKTSTQLDQVAELLFQKEDCLKSLLAESIFTLAGSNAPQRTGTAPGPKPNPPSLDKRDASMRNSCNGIWGLKAVFTQNKACVAAQDCG